MEKFVAFVCTVLLIGCTTGSKLNIVSPSASEDEVRARAQVVTSEKALPAKEEKAVTPQQSPEKPQESVAPEKTNSPKEPIMKSSREEALINLLEKKGIITRKELMEEIKRLEQGAK